MCTILAQKFGSFSQGPKKHIHSHRSSMAMAAWRTLRIASAYSQICPSQRISLSEACPIFLPSRVALGARCMGDEGVKVPARLAQKQKFLEEREAEASIPEANEPIPRITLDHVSVSYARSGGPGGQNVNKVNTKVDMRFKVMGADWLPERVKTKLLQMEKNRINSDGELVISSTKTRTQKGNLEDALAKLQEMIDAAAYVPPPPSEETKKRIRMLAAKEDRNRLLQKKQQATKKSSRREKGSWD